MVCLRLEGNIVVLYFKFQILLPSTSRLWVTYCFRLQILVVAFSVSAQWRFIACESCCRTPAASSRDLEQHHGRWSLVDAGELWLQFGATASRWPALVFVVSSLLAWAVRCRCPVRSSAVLKVCGSGFDGHVTTSRCPWLWTAMFTRPTEHHFSGGEGRRT